MTDLLLGTVLALAVTIGVLAIFFLRSSGVLVQVLPFGDGFEHTAGRCECMPQILLSFGRTYVVHKDLRDLADLALDFS